MAGRPRKNNLRERIFMLKQSGDSLHAIAKRLHITEGQVQYYLYNRVDKYKKRGAENQKTA